LSRAIWLADPPKHPRSPMRDWMVSSRQAVARKRPSSSSCWLEAGLGQGNDDAMADRAIASRIGDWPSVGRRSESHCGQANAAKSRGCNLSVRAHASDGRAEIGSAAGAAETWSHEFPTALRGPQLRHADRICTSKGNAALAGARWERWPPPNNPAALLFICCELSSASMSSGICLRR
jgi:hypothetical protein